VERGVLFWVRAKSVLGTETQERMLHKDYDRKGSVKKISGRESQGA
jgi:hypothetical protein